MCNRTSWSRSAAISTISMMATLGAVQQLSAATYEWNQLSGGDASGSWATEGAWNPTGPAAGQDNVADFSKQDITAASTVTLDGDQSIGHLVFGDSDTGSAGSWIIAPGTPSTSKLTLDVSSGTPSIQTSVDAAINVPLAGTNGFSKTGSGQLSLGASNSGLSGGITVSAGTLRLEDTGALGSNAVTLAGGNLAIGTTTSFNYGVDVVVAQNATISAPNNNVLYTFDDLSVAAGRTLTISSTSSVNNARYAFDETTIAGDARFLVSIGTSSKHETNPTLTFGAIKLDDSVASGTTSTLTFSVASPSVGRTRIFRVNGPISDADAEKKLAVKIIAADTRNSPTQVTMTAVNTYTGLTWVSTAGLLTLDNGGSLATSNILIDKTGKLEGGTTGERGTINYLIDGSDFIAIQIADTGVLDLTNLKLNISAVAPTLSEYVIADKPVGSANILGTEFFSVSGLEPGWLIDYDGTAANPNAIVLVVPEPASLASLALGGLLLLRRRRA